MYKKNELGIRLNKKTVFEAAGIIATRSKMPTIKLIRMELGGGSETTIHKYLDHWKKELLQLANQITEGTITPLKIAPDSNRDLEQALITQSTQTKVLTDQLIQSEKENMTLKDQNESLQSELKAITEKYKALLLKDEHLEKLCQEIKAERAVMAEAIMKDKNNQIQFLQQELREMNKASLEQIKKMGFEGDDALIQEKVKSIQLEDKVKLLEDQLKSLEKELKAAKEANQPLIERMRKQKEFVQKIVTSEQFQKFEEVFNKGWGI